MTTDTKAELLACPFCGGEAERIDIEDGENAGGSCIACRGCGASSNVEFERKENFVSNWNRRADRTHAPGRDESSPAPAVTGWRTMDDAEMEAIKREQIEIHAWHPSGNIHNVYWEGDGWLQSVGMAEHRWASDAFTHWRFQPLPPPPGGA